MPRITVRKMHSKVYYKESFKLIKKGFKIVIKIPIWHRYILQIWILWLKMIYNLLKTSWKKN